MTGKAKIRRNGLNHYESAGLEAAVDENDILWLEKGAEVKILFKDGSYILNEPQIQTPL